MLYGVPANNGLIKVYAEDVYGCKDSTSMYVVVTKDRRIYIPNVFSPGNSENGNHRWGVFTQPSQIEKIELLQVYDRSGGLIFEKRNYLPEDFDAFWDGTTDNGQNAPVGVYTYLAKVKFIDSEVVHYSGDVTIVR